MARLREGGRNRAYRGTPLHYVIASIVAVMLTPVCGALAHRFLLPLMHRVLGRAKSADLVGVTAGPIIVTPTIMATLSILVWEATLSKRERPEGAPWAASPYTALAPVMPAAAAILTALHLRFGFRERRHRQFLASDTGIVTPRGERVEASGFTITEQYRQTDAFHGHGFYTIELRLDRSRDCKGVLLGGATRTGAD